LTIYILVIKSIQTCPPHLTHGMQYTSAKRKLQQWYALHTRVHTCIHICWTSMCAHAYVPVTW